MAIPDAAAARTARDAAALQPSELRGGFAVNCCTGNCNQGRDCPARCADDEGEELSQMETVMLYMIVFAGLAILTTFAGLLVGYIVGVFA